MKIWICLPILFAVSYLLYDKGILIVRRTAAIMIVFQRGRNTDNATLTSCHGWLKYVRKFDESRTYEFSLDTQLSDGNAEVTLLDKEKRQLIKLNQQSPVGRIDLNAKTKCYLRWEFKNATGKCELRW